MALLQRKSQLEQVVSLIGSVLEPYVVEPTIWFRAWSSNMLFANNLILII